MEEIDALDTIALLVRPAQPDAGNAGRLWRRARTAERRLDSGPNSSRRSWTDQCACTDCRPSTNCGRSNYCGDSDRRSASPILSYSAGHSIELC
jgi:hypothetical protein